MAPTNAELTAENAELTAENDRLRAELVELRSNPRVMPDTAQVRRAPSFGMSEGERSDIERTGKSVSPFTGEVLTAADLPERVTIDPAGRQASDTGPRTVIGGDDDAAPAGGE